MEVGNILFYTHYVIVLIFGILLSIAYVGIQFQKKSNIIVATTLFAICGILQLVTYHTLGESMVWKIYPLIVHLPIVLVLSLYYRRNLIMVLSAVSTAYLCCQPAKWLGILCNTLTHNYAAEQLTRISTLLLVGFVSLYHLAPYLSQLFQKDKKSVCIFGSIPIIYYVFDYTIGIYTDLRTTNSPLVAEFTPFLLCVVFMLFVIIYYKEYEQKADTEHKEQIIRIVAEQRAKELEAMKKSEQEIRLLRHDMRFLLNNLAVCIEQENKEQALKMLSGFVEQVDAASVHRYCKNDTINCILTNFESKCKEREIDYRVIVEIEDLFVDEILFSSIISNALENAMHAQDGLPVAKRFIKLMLKYDNDKLLLSVKNPFEEMPTFVDGVPITHRKGHGYGTQSILYLTEKLGGKYQFTLKDNIFIFRVVI